MNYEEFRLKIKEKQKKLYLVMGTIILLLFLAITFPPVVSLWDRNDIYVGVFPLSLFCILLFPMLAVVAMYVMYSIDKKLVSELKEAKRLKTQKGGGKHE